MAERQERISGHWVSKMVRERQAEGGRLSKGGLKEGNTSI